MQKSQQKLQIEILEKLRNKNLFICTKSEVADFTIDKQIFLIICYDEVRIEMPVPVKEIKKFLGDIKDYLFCSNNIIIGWNIKNIFSYVLGRTGFPLTVNNKLYDLKIMENYIGIENNCPQSFEEAKTRLKNIVGHQSFNKLKLIYNEIYDPLIKIVIPQIENNGIIYNRNKFYSYYEIAGQINGRMKCSNVYKNSYNPHTMKRNNEYRPPDPDGMFVYIDIKHMEVSVLQWLSKDIELKKIIDSGEDLYAGIWKKITDVDSNEKYRAICKNIFLPVIYGEGIQSVSERLKISLNSAKILKDKINKIFYCSVNYVQNYNSNECFDYFGRYRKFDNENYKIRNFLIQSPSAILCMDKLVCLHNDLQNIAKIGFNVHDGYGIFAKVNNVKQIISIAEKSLRKPSKFFPDMKINTSCQVSNKF